MGLGGVQRRETNRPLADLTRNVWGAVQSRVFDTAKGLVLSSGARGGLAVEFCEFPPHRHAHTILEPELRD